MIRNDWNGDNLMDKPNNSQNGSDLKQKGQRRFVAMLLICCFLFLMGACAKETEKNLKTPESTLLEHFDPDTTYTRDVDAFEAYVAARTKAGDTIAIKHEKLAALLPDSLTGFSLEIDKASTFETNSFTFSEATRVFYNDEQNYIEFIAGDYVANADFFRVNLQRYNLAQGQNIKGLIDKKIYVKDLFPANAKEYFTWSTYNQEKRISRVYLGLDYRFFITVEATDQDDFLDMGQLSGWIDWSGLSE